MAKIEIEYSDGQTTAIHIDRPRAIHIDHRAPNYEVAVTMGPESHYEKTAKPTAYFSIQEARRIVREEDLVRILKELGQ